MKHEQVVRLLPDWAEGRLQAGVADGVTAHLAGCEECRSLSATYDFLASSLRPGPTNAPSTHPSSQEIVSFALRAEAPGEGKTAAIASHLRSCPHCALEMATVRKAEDAARAPSLAFPARWLGAAPGFPRPGLAAALAAGIVMAVLGYPAFRGLRELPRLERRADELQAEKERLAMESERKMHELQSELDRKLEGARREVAHPGPVALNFLGGSTREGGSAEMPPIRAEGPSIYFAVAADPDAIPKGDEPCRLEILAEDRVAWSWDLMSARIREDLNSPQGSLVVLIPAAALPPGPYRIRLMRTHVPQAKPLFLQSFRIIR